MTHTTYRSICVPLDGSPFAEQALPLAAEIAHRSGASLQIAMVHHPVPAFAMALEVPEVEAQVDEEARAREHTYLASMVDRVRKIHAIPAAGIHLDGAVAHALEEHLVRSHADLVVITTHGRGPASRFWLGSIADQLMRRLHMSLLLLRPNGTIVPPVTIRRILVALDGSSFSERAIEAAVTLGRPFGAEYALLTVIEPPAPILDPSGIGAIGVVADAERQAMAATTKYLEEQARRLRQNGLKVTTHPVQGLGVAATIIAEAETLQADLVAVASHGAGGVERLLLGSVADKVIRGSTHPTLVVRPPKEPAAP